MAISITSRNYATRNHTGGNTFLLQNGGQIVTETIDFVIDFEFVSSQSEQVQFISETSIQILGGDWGSKGFIIGDSIVLAGSIASTPFGVSTTITDIDGDLLTFASPVTGSTGQVMPLLAGSDSNSPLTIVNSSRSIPESVEVYHNIVSNASSGSINSFVDGEVNRFEVNGVNTMSVSDVLPLIQLGNKSGGSYYSATIERLADVSSNKAGRITLEYKLPTEFEDSDFDFPSYLSGSQSLKPFITINCYPQENNPNSQLTISYGSQNGNVGWYNESHNQGVNDFTIDSVLITDIDNNPLSAFDYSRVNKVTAVISGSTSFVKKAELNFYTIPEQIDVKNKLASRKDLIYDSNSFIDNTTITNKVSGILGRNVAITNQVLTLGTNEITIEFRLAPNTAFTEYFEVLPSEQRRIRLTASVESDGGDANNNNNVSLILEQGLGEKAPIFGGVYNDVTSNVLYDHVDNELLPSDEPCGCDTIKVTYQLVGEEPVTVEVEKVDGIYTTEIDGEQYELVNTGTQWEFRKQSVWILEYEGVDYISHYYTGDAIDLVIDWGDGTIDTITGTVEYPSHTYASTGNYTVKISGTLGGNGHVEVGDNNSSGGAFIVSTSAIRIDGVTNFSGTFYNCTALTTIPTDLFKYNVDVVYFNRTFYNCTALTTIPTDLFKYNVDVVYFNQTFYNCTALTTIPTDLFKYNVDVTDFNQTFYNCTALTTIPTDLFKYNVDVTDFSGTFYNCTALTTIPTDLFKYNVDVIYFNQTFYNCTALTTIPTDLFKYNVDVVYFNQTFYNCTALTTIPTDLFKYNVDVVYFNRTFLGCSGLTMRNDIFDFNNFINKSIDFSSFFLISTPFSGTIGTAPELWNADFGTGTPITIDAFQGHSVSSLTNYNDIPTLWL